MSINLILLYFKMVDFIHAYKFLLSYLAGFSTSIHTESSTNETISFSSLQVFAWRNFLPPRTRKNRRKWRHRSYTASRWRETSVYYNYRTDRSASLRRRLSRPSLTCLPPVTCGVRWTARRRRWGRSWRTPYRDRPYCTYATGG